MVIFNSYVKLPEGSWVSLYRRTFFLGQTMAKERYDNGHTIHYNSISKEFMITPQGLVGYTIHPTLDLLGYMIYIYVIIRI